MERMAELGMRRSAHMTTTEEFRSNPTGVSIVVPVYNSDASLSPLVERINTTFGPRAHEIILVDDGSAPATWAAIQRLMPTASNVRAVRLRRNAGQHSAIIAGVRLASLPIIVTLDDDLQNPPEEIPRLLSALSDEVDVVYGSAPVSAQNLWRRLAGRLSRWALSGALGAQAAAHMSAFRAFRTDLRDAFAGDLGPAVSVDALLSWATARFTYVEVRHDPRGIGTSNYSFRRLTRFALDTITGYSATPLKLASMLGMIMAAFGTLVLAWVLGRYVVTGDSVPGFPFLASTIALFSGAQLTTLGVIGEYLARMHFRVMGQPTYVLAETLSSENLAVPSAIEVDR